MQKKGLSRGRTVIGGEDLSPDEGEEGEKEGGVVAQ